MKNPQIGKVTLVGAGPGDPELLTLKALKVIQQADVIVHDRLVSPEVLAHAPAHARLISVGKQPGHHSVPQDQINELLVHLAFQGLNVTRLKGGDPLTFGRGGEELEALREAGIACSCVPGITAAQGAAASLQLPLTQRGLATGLRYVTGHRAANASLNLDWASLASEDTTLAVYMGAATIGEFATQLIQHGLPATTPVLAIASATTPQERRKCSTLSKIADALADDHSGDPVLFIIGRVVTMVAQTQSIDGFLQEIQAVHDHVAV